MQDNYTPPELWAAVFNCPYCHACTGQTWESIPSRNLTIKYLEDTPQDAYPHTYNTQRSICDKCKGECLWIEERMVFPDTGHAPPPNDDLSDEIKEIYNEAAEVSSKSSRASAALLRLALEKLCKEQGEDNKSLQENIDFLVKKKELPSQIIKAMDTVRIIGNEAVHPGTLDLRDDIGTVKTIFKLINLIANKLISEPREFDSLYDALPDSKKRKDTQ